MSDSNPLSRRIHSKATFEIQPVRTGQESEFGPVLLFVELADQSQQVVGRGLDVAAEFGDLVAELFAFSLLESGVCKNGG